MTIKSALPKTSHFIPYTPQVEKEMLETMGLESFEELISAIPEKLRVNGDIPLPSRMSELEVVRHIYKLSKKNISSEESLSFLGGGAYEHFIPRAVSYLISRSEFSTSYTPYQAEVSQGTLQAIYEFQTMICEISGMEVANASLYDGASAVAEACLFSHRVNEKLKVLISEGLYHNYREVVKTYLENSLLTVEWIPSKNGKVDVTWLANKLNEEISAVVVQSPNRLGLIEPWKKIGSLCSHYPSLFVAVGDPISLGIFATPGECQADVYVGEGQVLGSPVSLGGPFLGLFATKMEYVRKMPGRIVGATKDLDGKPGFVLALQTREQHIRRERATSNICTNQGLIALSATIYLALLGREGLKKVAELCFQKAHYTAELIQKLPGYNLPFGGMFFNEFVVKCPVQVEKILETGIEEKVIAGTLLRDDPTYLRIAVTEIHMREDIHRLVDFLSQFKS